MKEDSEHSDLLIAWGMGFAPIKSLAEHAMALNKAEDVHLYWFAKEGDHYLDNQCRAWADALDNFHYHPVILDEDETFDAQQFEDLSSPRDYDIYISAPDAQKKRLEAYFESVGVPEGQIISESTLGT